MGCSSSQAEEKPSDLKVTLFPNKFAAPAPVFYGHHSHHTDVSGSLQNPSTNPQKEAPKDPFAGLPPSELKAGEKAGVLRTASSLPSASTATSSPAQAIIAAAAAAVSPVKITIFEAATRGDVESLKQLLKPGLFSHSNVDAVDTTGQTALHCAVRACKLDCVRLLLEHKANANKRDSEGRTALHFAQTVEIATVLLNSGAEPNKRDQDGETPLIRSVRRKNAALVKLLIERKADASVKNCKGETALDIAKNKKLDEIAALLPATAASAAAGESKDASPSSATAIAAAVPAAPAVESDDAKLARAQADLAKLTINSQSVLAAAGVADSEMQDTAVALLRGVECKLEPVAVDSDAWWDLVATLRGNLLGDVPEYYAARLRDGLQPLTLTLAAAERVENPTLAGRFAGCRDRLKQAGRTPAECQEHVAFHGSSPANIKRICDKGLLHVGHPLNPNNRVDVGLFGVPEKGVYVNKTADYTVKFSNRLMPLNENETCKIILFHVLPGRSLHVKQPTPNLHPTHGYDSHLSTNQQEWYLFNEAQALPICVLTVKAVVQRRAETDDI